MKCLIGCMALLCLVALMAACGGGNGGTLAYVNDATPTGAVGFRVLNVNNDGTLSPANIGNQGAGSTKVIQITRDERFAYYLDAAGTNLIGYQRGADGALVQALGSLPLNGPGSSLAISTDSQYVYVAIPSELGGALAIFHIDSNGVLHAQSAQDIPLGFPITQLIMSPSGNVLYGLSPSKGQVVSIELTADLFKAKSSTAVGQNPPDNGMILSPDGKYMYVLDTQLVGPSQPNTSGNPPVFFGFTTCMANNSCSASAGILSPMGGTSVGTCGSGGVFCENVDNLLLDPNNNGNPTFPSDPVAGAVSADSQFLFIANKGSGDISVFNITTLPGGQPTEILGSIQNQGGTPITTQSPFLCSCSPDFIAVPPKNANFIYVLDDSAASIFQFTDQGIGVLRSLSPASVSVGGSPSFITMH